MATRLENWSREEIRSVIRFLWAKHLTAAEIHRQLVEVYGETVMSRQHVAEWCRKFAAGRENLTDEDRSGRPSTASTDCNTARVEELIQDNRRITLRHMTVELGMSFGSVRHIVHDILQYRKVCSRWVPRNLSNQHKEKRMGASLQLLQRFSTEGNSFLHRIVTGDETWVHHYTPSSKRSSMEWKHTSSPKTKKFKVTPSAGKVMATVFWDSAGVILVDFLERGHTVTADRYCETLTRLREAIRRKRPGLLTEGVIFLHDNARPHTAQKTTTLLKQFRWDIIDHPPYSPDLAPSDFHLFPHFKEHLGGRRFASDEEVKHFATTWLNTQGQDFYQEGIFKLIPRSDKCLNRNGDYVEK